jgi:ankyrin repeat protein
MMTKRTITFTIRGLVSYTLLHTAICACSQVPQTLNIVNGTKIEPGFEMGVDSSDNRTHWVEQDSGCFRMAYPAGQSWGAVWVSFGPSVSPPRPGKDLSSYSSLSVIVAGEPGKSLQIGIKDRLQPDDGSEAKLTLLLGAEPRSYAIPLKSFAPADLTSLYVVAEFVFSGPEPVNAWFCGLRYSTESTSPVHGVLKGARVQGSAAAGVQAAVFLDEVKKGDMDEVKALVRTDRRLVSSETDDGTTPLSLAAIYGYNEIAKFLFDNGADVNTPDKLGRTPLHDAAMFDHNDIIELLLTHKADVNALDRDGRPAMFFAIDEEDIEVVRQLIGKGANVNLQDQDGEGPLFWAVNEGRNDIAELLLAHKADINAKDNDGKTLLHWAAEKGLENIATFLLDHKADVNAKDKDGNSPLHYAVRGGSQGVSELLKKHGGLDTATPKTRFYEAIGDGNLGAVKALSSDHPELLFSADDLGQTPLHWAAGSGQQEVAEFLLAHNANINAKTKRGRTPLHFAALNNHRDVAKLLLANKADLDARADDGATPLSDAANEGNEDLVEFLVTQRADVNARDENGRTPLFAAVWSQKAAVVRRMILAKSDVNVKANDGNTPLHAAAVYGDADVVELLLDYGAAINVKNNDGETPLHVAERNDNIAVADLLRQHGGQE